MWDYNPKLEKLSKFLLLFIGNIYVYKLFFYLNIKESLIVS